MGEDRFETINVGDETEIFHEISTEDVDVFAKLTGDDNPLHMDDEYAATTSFNKRVVHGMLTASFISTIIGTKLPGKGALWYEQKLTFLGPVHIGERIRVCAKVRRKSQAQRIITLSTIIYGNDNRKVIEGEAKIKIVKPELKEISSMKTKQSGAVIVTGGSRGIGAAICYKLALAGYPVVVNYVKNRDRAEKLVKNIKSEKGNAVAFQADVVNGDVVKEMVAFTLNKFDKITGVVNNASAPLDTQSFDQLLWDDIQHHLDIQVKGTFNICKTVLPYLLEAKTGIIVNMASSVAYNVPPPKMLSYTLAKSALISFSRSIAVEYGPMGIRVNCVSPGMTNTELISNLPEKAKMLAKMQTPLRRLAFPEDIAGVVEFLFSDAACHLTGENIRVCGGSIMA